MTAPPVVSNSSPIIALSGIGQLELLKQLFTQVVVPPAVARETSISNQIDWITVVPLAQPLASGISGAGLGLGESEAISLAMEHGATWLLIDDKPARRLAAQLGLPILGTLGVLLACKRRGLLPNVRPSIDAIIQFGFRVSPALRKRVLEDAGEDSV